jgi:Cu/Ag efflux protein CusF
MRTLAAALLLALVSSTLAAADKDEDKAKEVAAAFMKAVKAKDIDAIMKTVDVPFLTDDKDGIKVIEKTEDLRADLKAKLEMIKDTEKIPTEVGNVLDLPALRKKIEGKKDKEETLKQIEKVLGDKGYAVMIGKPGEERGGVLVRIKDGKAAVVGIPH